MRHRAFLLSLFIFFLAAAGQANWVPIGPFGGDARSLAADPRTPDRLYLGTRTGQVYTTTDGGWLWRRLTALEAPADWVVDDLLVDPTDPRVLYAGMWSVRNDGGGVFKSTDGGRSWKLLEGLRGQAVRALAIAPSNSQTLVAGTLTGVYRTQNAGAEWRRISPEGHPEIRNLESVAIDPADPQTIYVGTWHLPWKTTDGGAHWRSIKNGMIDDSDVFSIVVHPTRSQTLYAGACTGIYRSDNGGGLWRKIQGIPTSSRRTHRLVFDPQDPETVYAGTTEGLWRTKNGGESWSRLTSHTWSINAVLINPRDSNHFYLGMDHAGVMESRDGFTFRAANRGFSQRQVSRIVVDARNQRRLYAALLHDGEFGGVYVTDNGGASWQQWNTGLGGRDVLSLLLVTQPPGKLLAGTPDGVFEYFPEKQAWEDHSRWEVPSSRPTVVRDPVRVWDLFQRNPDEPIYAATSAGLFRSSDARVWQRLPLHAGQEGVYTIATFGNDGKTLLAATGVGLEMSVDAGRTWSAIRLDGNAPIKVRKIAAPAALANTLFVGTEQGLFRSTDAGRSWQKFGRGLPLSPINEIVELPGNPPRILVAGNVGLFHSSDGGNEYSRLGAGEGPEGLPIQLLTFHMPERLQILAASPHNGLFLTNPTESLIPPPQRSRQ